MVIIRNTSAEVVDTNAHHFFFEEYSDNNEEEIVFCYGYNSSNDLNVRLKAQNTKRKVFFNNWAPTEFAQPFDHFRKTPLSYDDFFNEIYSICPYSNKWLNGLGFSHKKYKNIFYPFNKNLIPQTTEKKYDVIYHGGIHGQEHLDCLEVINKFNYRYCSMTHSINPLTQYCLKYATNLNLPFKNKIQLVSECKISVCYNLVHVLPEHTLNIKSWNNWSENEAFSEIDKTNLMPQFKTRMHEAAISKTLNLIQIDKWNIAERYYIPNEEFIYFTNKFDLEEKIKDIIDNWENYVPIVEKAYKRSLKYTTDNFLKLIETNKEWNNYYAEK
jgi:hypothetical protein